MGEELRGIIPKKLESGAFSRFKVERAILEKFGKDGLLVYQHIDGKKNAEEIEAELSLGDEKITDILDFMEKGNLVKLQTIFELEMEKKERSKL
ncbi:MAG: hypothetical protein ABIH99_04175 [Candidatus Micrarchaeota archaeon]